MHKYKITLEYDGTGYRGWQTQKNARSIQGTLIDASQTLFGTAIELQGAGRTDAGVHALAQVAHIATSRKMKPRVLMEGLNDLLPATINIRSVEEVARDFHARHHAKKRSYLYIISRRRTAFGKHYSWWVKDAVDVRRMAAALKELEGFHDFSSFADKRREKNESATVSMYAAELYELYDLIVLRFVASHFLWKMVRRIVGILVEVGRGKVTPADIKGMLASFSELPARLTAPPSGLFLEKVFYEGDIQTAANPPPLPLLFT